MYVRIGLEDDNEKKEGPVSGIRVYMQGCLRCKHNFNYSWTRVYNWMVTARIVFSRSHDPDKA